MSKMYIENKKFSLLLNVIFILSIPFMTLLLLRQCDIWLLIVSLFISFGLGIFLVLKFFKKHLKKINIYYLLFSLFFALFFTKYYFNFHTNVYYGDLLFNFQQYNISFKYIYLLCVFALPAVTLFIYLGILILYPIIKKFFVNLSNFEKKYLFIVSIIGFFLTLILYYFINVFFISEPHFYDVFFTSDSILLFSGETFLNFAYIENDLRQPLFGLYAFPFALVSKILSELFFFIPNGYAVFLNTIQIIVLNITILMITKLLKLNNSDKFNFILLYIFSFSTIAFSFIIEQYIFALFYVILTIYIYYETKCKVNYMYIGAPGTLLTSGVLFPFISKFKNWKYFCLNVLKCFLVFASIVILIGLIPFIFEIPDNIKDLNAFVGDAVGFSDKILMYLSFVSSIFIAPPAEIVDVVNHKGYMVCFPGKVNILGILILIICFISFILNRKNKMAVISFLWILFSFALLCLFGWGTAENGLILYSLYFSWAFIILIYLFITKIIKNTLWQRIVIVLLVLIMFAFNVMDFYNMISFGLKYY